MKESKHKGPDDYIGQTGQSLATRVSQHKGYIRSANENKSVFVHMSTHNHPIDFDNSNIIKYTSSVIDRNIIESALINYHSNDLFNIRPGPLCLDSFIVKKLILFLNLNS